MYLDDEVCLPEVGVNLVPRWDAFLLGSTVGRAGRKLGAGAGVAYYVVVVRNVGVQRLNGRESPRALNQLCVLRRLFSRQFSLFYSRDIQRIDGGNQQAARQFGSEQ